MHYTLTSDAEFTGGSVILADGTTYPFTGTHPKYKEIVSHLVAGDLNEDQILDLVNPFESVFRNLTALSERVSRKGTFLYFDGDKLDNSLAKTILRIIDEDGFANPAQWGAYVKFLDLLMQNPSQDSRDHFYKYIEAHGLTITPDGHAILYKGVRLNQDKTGKGRYTSTQQGFGLVTTPDGKTVEYKHDLLPNDVGYVVSIPRSLVDTNRGRHCSTGLHAGTMDYVIGTMKTPVILTVSVNPRDVVSVPSDHGDAKVRVSRYTVLEVNEAQKKYESVVATPGAKPVKATPVVKATDGSRVDEYKKLIPQLLKAGTSLRKFKSKNVTAKRRGEFVQAAKELGYDIG